MKGFGNVDSSSDLEKEKEDQIEEVVLSPPSNRLSRAESHSSDSTASQGEAITRTIIRFKDGDPDNPNNWRQVRTSSQLTLYANQTAAKEDVRTLRSHYEW